MGEHVLIYHFFDFSDIIHHSCRSQIIGFRIIALISGVTWFTTGHKQFVQPVCALHDIIRHILNFLVD